MKYMHILLLVKSRKKRNMTASEKLQYVLQRKSDYPKPKSKLSMPIPNKWKSIEICHVMWSIREGREKYFILLSNH